MVFADHNNDRCRRGSLSHQGDQCVKVILLIPFEEDHHGVRNPYSIEEDQISHTDTLAPWSDPHRRLRRSRAQMETGTGTAQIRARQAAREVRQSNHSFGHNRARRGRWSPRRQVHLAYRFFPTRLSIDGYPHRRKCGYCGASARIKFDDEQFAALFNVVWSLKLCPQIRAIIVESRTC